MRKPGITTSAVHAMLWVYYCLIR